MSRFTASAVVPFAVARSARHELATGDDAWRLVRLRHAVDVGAEGDHRLAGSPSRHPRRRDVGDAALDLESLALEDAGHVALRFHFLEPQLTEAEDRVHHLLREDAARVHVGGRLLFQGVEARRIGRGASGWW
jgi:hypothetical protein